MSKIRAVVWIDHHHARVFRLGEEHVDVKKIEAHAHHTHQHGSHVRTEHEFFGEVCDALAGIAECLVSGAHLAQSDFRHYVTRHRPHLSQQLVGWETVDKPSDAEMRALGGKFFSDYDAMGGRAG